LTPGPTEGREGPRRPTPGDASERSAPAHAPEVSVIVPVYRTETHVAELCRRLGAALDGVRSEWVFVDDGSPDGSCTLLERLQRDEPRIRIVVLSRNFGQHAALCAGFEAARGAIVVTLDCDLQYAPEDIPRFLERSREGYDLVSGWRESRADPLVGRRLPSYMFNAIVRSVTGVPLHDYGCALNAIRREVLVQLPDYGEKRRFLKPLLAQLARRVTEVRIRGHARQGRSAYGIWTLLGLVVDFVISFSAKPFQIVGVGGLGLFGSGAVAGFAYLVARVAGWIDANPPLTVILFLALVLGMQFSVLGLVGEFTQRTYRLVQDRPFFVVDRVLEPGRPAPDDGRVETNAS